MLMDSWRGLLLSGYIVRYNNLHKLLLPDSETFRASNFTNQRISLFSLQSDYKFHDQEADVKGYLPLFLHFIF